MEIYPQANGKPNAGSLYWTFPSGAKIRFGHMQHEQDVISWKGAEITLIIFDELTDFSEYQFFYMLSRNRSLCGIKPYMRAATNPDSESWVKHLLAPWVDPDWPEQAVKEGFHQPRSAASGEVRSFVRESGVLRWCEHKSEPMAKSITFIAANVYDNKILMEKDPGYVANLHALPDLEKQRLLGGSWVVRPSGRKFKREWFPVIEEEPRDIVARVRFWDLAATEFAEEASLGQKQSLKDGPDFTAGVLVGRTARNTFVVLNAVWFRKSPLGVQQTIRQIAELDGPDVSIWMEQEGGAGGPTTIDTYRREVLLDADFHAKKQRKNKLERANIVASHAELSNISLLRGPWNEGFLNFMMAFPNPRVHDDTPDAFFSGMIVLIEQGEDIPTAFGGGRDEKRWYAKNERMYVPAPQEMDEEQREAIIARQVVLQAVITQLRSGGSFGQPAHRSSLEDEDVGGWI